MKAVVARAFAPLDQLDWADWPEPRPRGGEVVIEAEAIGVNFADGLLVQGLYQMKPPLPFIPGMEVAGRVVEVGDTVTAFAVGDRVAAFCGLGAFAERVAVPAGAVFRLADGMAPADGCALMCAYGTAHHALKQRGRLCAGETLAVTGAAGATGIAAVQIGKAMGARVIAIASTEEKRALALAAGADEALGYDGVRDGLKAATGGAGVDVAFDTVGGDAFDALARSMAWDGRLLVIGFASGTIPRFPVNLALVKGFAVVGVFWGSFTQREPDLNAANMAELFAWHRDGKLRPLIGGRHRLEEAASVLATVMARGAVGKIILEPGR